MAPRLFLFHVISEQMLQRAQQRFMFIMSTLTWQTVRLPIHFRVHPAEHSKSSKAHTQADTRHGYEENDVRDSRNAFWWDRTETNKIHIVNKTKTQKENVTREGHNKKQPRIYQYYAQSRPPKADPVPGVYSHDIDPHSYDVDPLEEGRVFKEQSLFACKQAAA